MAKRKKKVLKSKVDPGPQEYEGWSVGDVAWFPARYEATPRQGTIKGFHPKDRTAPCASLYDMGGGGYRVIPLKYIFENKKEAKASRSDYLDFLSSFGSRHD